MSPASSIPQWTRVVAGRLPHLSRPQATVLARWSWATVLLGNAGVTRVSQMLSLLCGGQVSAWRQRWREWTYEAPHKRGLHRQHLEVALCFPALLRWVLAWWEPDDHRLALALDATTLTDRFTVLTISVLVRGCAVPVAWHLVGATTPGAWKPHWLALLRGLHGVIPSDWFVLVTADRGLYAEWLFAGMVQLGWHPFLRINTGGLFQRASGSAWHALAEVAPRPGTGWQGRVQCFHEHPLRCTLLARWDPGYAHPWLILTDLPPEEAEIVWYRLRGWIEQGFKDCKRGGWQWHHTKMTDPQRAERLWLVLAVATLWVVSVGCQAEAAAPVNVLAQGSPMRSPAPRALSVFARGLIEIRAHLLRHHSLLVGCFRSFAWITNQPPPLPMTSVFLASCIPKTYP